MQCCARTKCLSWMWLSHLPAPLLGSLELSRTDVLNPWFSLELFFSQFVYVPSGTVLNAKHIGPDLNGWVPALEDCQGTSESLCTTNSTIASFKCFQDRVTKYSPGPCLQLCVLQQMNPLQALGHSLLDTVSAQEGTSIMWHSLMVNIRAMCIPHRDSGSAWKVQLVQKFNSRKPVLAVLVSPFSTCWHQ